MSEPNSKILRRVAAEPTSVADLRALPDSVIELLREASASPRLVAHLRAVHDVACDLLEAFECAFPTLDIDADAVRFGAATHDIGKARYPEELHGDGSRHEDEGRRLLIESGVPDSLARFASQHARWDAADVECEIVSLADKVWKGKRQPDLENLIVERICLSTGSETWEVFMQLDDVLVTIANGSDDRLAFQNQFPA